MKILTNQKHLFLALTTVALAFFLGLYFHTGPKAEDVEINVRQEKNAPGSLRFEGNIINTGAKDISEVTVTATITQLRFDDPALDGCALQSPIATVRNLKAGEAREVIWYYEQGDGHLRCGRTIHPNQETFTYTTYWNSFKWNVWVSKVK